MGEVKRDKWGHRLCEHGRTRYVCKECGGTGICEHGRQRSTCKDCGGTGICEHGRRRVVCKDCGNSRTSGLHPFIVGSLAEHLVAIDLYRRGLCELTWPDVQQSKDDLHARFRSGWRSIQVKAKPVNKTGSVFTSLPKTGPNNITSHIAAFVGVVTGEIVYRSVDGRPLPEELCL